MNESFLDIQNLISDIEKRRIVIPSFQRQYVWSFSNAKFLIESIVKDFPIGSILTWETDEKIILRKEDTYANKSSIVLLDGQQRLTTLYTLLKKEPPYYLPDVNNPTINSLKKASINIRTLDVSTFKTSDSENHEIFLISEILSEGYIINDKFKIALDKIGNDLVLKNTNKIRNIIKKTFPVIKLPNDTSYENAIDIFYRVNKAGTPLAQSDLSAAKMSSFLPNINNEIQKERENFKSLGFGKMTTNFLVNSIMSATFYNNVNYLLLANSENKSKIEKTWLLMKNKVFNYLINILKQHFLILGDDEFKSYNVLIPLIVFIKKKFLEKSNITNQEIEAMRRWFFIAQIAARYSGSSATTIDADIKYIRDEKNPFDKLIEVIAKENVDIFNKKINPDNLIGETKNSSYGHVFKLYLRIKNVNCPVSKVSLGANQGQLYKIQSDHIFPKAKLKLIYKNKPRKEQKEIHEIANIMFMSAEANLDKLVSDPSEYLKSLQKNNAQVLKEQLIPEDESLWQIDSYKLFIQKRRDLIAKSISKFLFEKTELLKDDADNIQDISKLIYLDESETLEKKSSFLINLKSNIQDRYIIESSMKTIAGFANSDEGGILLLGVTDDNEIIGIDDDIMTMKKPDKDGYRLYVLQEIEKYFSKIFVINFIKIKYYEVDSKTLMVLNISPSNESIFFESKDGKNLSPKFFIRIDNSTKELIGQELSNYVIQQFGKN
jgi:hypothetical protein